MSFQKQVNITPALGVAGEFASVNPFFSLVAGEGQLTAGDDGLTVGVFGFADMATGKVSNAYADGNRIGFVIRNYNALITTYGAQSSMVIPAGHVVTLISNGDVFAKCADATVGQKVLALKADGTLKAVDVGVDATATELETGYIIAEVSVDDLVKITKEG